MSKFQYTVTNFDDKAKTLTVSFGVDSGYAKISLMAPLPENIDELEKIIRQYVLPQQYIDALDSPVDLSYINGIVGETRYCERRSIETKNVNMGWDVDEPYEEPSGEENDVSAAFAAAEAEMLNSKKEFSDAVEEVLRQHGIIK